MAFHCPKTDQMGSIGSTVNPCVSHCDLFGHQTVSFLQPADFAVKCFLIFSLLATKIAKPAPRKENLSLFDQLSRFVGALIIWQLLPDKR